MQPKEKQIVEVLTSPTAKFIVTVFLAGVAWARLENKVDEKFNGLIKTLEVHIATDSEEKKRLNERIAELSIAMEKMQDQAENFIRSEYIRPEEIRPKEERRRRDEPKQSNMS